MKKLILIAFISFIGVTANAQVELKVNPIALVLRGFQGGIEVGARPNIGIDIDAFGADGEFLLTGAVKYYFNPKTTIDGFHIGSFIGTGSSDLGVGAGFLGGYKWIASSEKVAFEVGGGIGRSFGEAEIIPYFRLHVGFRLKSTKDN